LGSMTAPRPALRGTATRHIVARGRNPSPAGADSSFRETTNQLAVSPYPACSLACHPRASALQYTLLPHAGRAEEADPLHTDSSPMPEVRDWRNSADPRPLVHRAAQALAGGEVVAFPTDTVYALAASALIPEAVEKLCRSTKRDDGRPMTLAVRGAGEAL